jgi:hypothetical protein
MVHRGQARPLPGMVEPPQRVMAQREVPVAPCDIGAGALEHLRAFGGFSLPGVLLDWAQRPSRAIGLKQWGAEALGPCTQRRSCGPRLR